MEDYYFRKRREIIRYIRRCRKPSKFQCKSARKLYAYYIFNATSLLEYMDSAWECTKTPPSISVERYLSIMRNFECEASTPDARAIFSSAVSVAEDIMYTIILEEEF